jgi:hypothetical protein
MIDSTGLVKRGLRDFIDVAKDWKKTHDRTLQHNDSASCHGFYAVHAFGRPGHGLLGHHRDSHERVAGS